MIERYQSTDDVVPHETTVLVVDDTDDACFGTPYTALLDEAESRFDSDGISLVPHIVRPDELPEFDTLIQYNVWLIKHSTLLVDGASTILSYLCTDSFPDETQVVVVVDTEDDEMAENLQSEISDDILTFSSETGVVSYLLGYLHTANPDSLAGREHIFAWNNEIADRVGGQRTID